MDIFLGIIKAFPYEFVPRGWTLCDGHLMNIQQNTALFALLSNRFGGDGKTTFAVPDLRGAEPDAGGLCRYYIATMGLFPPRD
jgi:microcystin-dependent protein